MSKGQKPLACASVLGLVLAGSVEGVGASMITLAPSGATVVDFSQFNGPALLTAGPVQVGKLVGEDIVYTANQSSSLIGNSFYGLATNGFWNSDRIGFTGVNNDTDDPPGPNAITFSFNSGPVNSVGGFMNYAPGLQGVARIEALGTGGTLLESYVLNIVAPISTPDATNAGAFRGIFRTKEDIVAFRYSGAAAVLDDLTFTRQQVPAIPEPATFFLVGTGVGGLAYRARLRRKDTHVCSV
jgi:hypothetical protein